jgi:Uma2 family endonuclease
LKLTDNCFSQEGQATDDQSGYEPDGIVLDRHALAQEPLWEKASVITLGTSVRLVIEVVSTNWQDDYLLKLGDYERLVLHTCI